MAGDDESAPVRWLRPSEVAEAWGVARNTVPRMAARRGVRTRQFDPPDDVRGRRGEQRYHSGDVDLVVKQLESGGETPPSD